MSTGTTAEHQLQYTYPSGQTPPTSGGAMPRTYAPLAPAMTASSSANSNSLRVTEPADGKEGKDDIGDRSASGEGPRAGASIEYKEVMRECVALAAWE